LAQVLRRMPTASHPDLLVGTATGDDAAVWRVDDKRAFVSTVDFFTPLVDDAFTWGAIAAANSVSDVYAMGGRPFMALNIAAWPRDRLPFDLLADVLAGASAAAARGGWIVGGGHTVDGPEPMFGQSVLGEVMIDQIMTNDAGREGDILVLTKALGTGTITTALKRSTADDVNSGWLKPAVDAAVASMMHLNSTASTAAIRAGVRAATDITGFGLSGHLHKLALASGLEARVSFDRLPILPLTHEILTKGFVPGGTGRNLDFVQGSMVIETSTVDAHRLMADPQTSGGLLLCVRPERVDALCMELLASGDVASVIGSLTAGTPGRVVVR
jgi:selenide, water dikinase